jgi:hypothetical protein
MTNKEKLHEEAEAQRLMAEVSRKTYQFSVNAINSDE